MHGPGFCWPGYLIDRVVRVPVKRVQEVPITRFSGKPFATIPDDPQEGESSSEAEKGSLDPREVGYCLTGDSNIVHVDLVAKYQVSDPVRYAISI